MQLRRENGTPLQLRAARAINHYNNTSHHAGSWQLFIQQPSGLVFNLDVLYVKLEVPGALNSNFHTGNLEFDVRYIYCMVLET